MRTVIIFDMKVEPSYPWMIMLMVPSQHLLMLSVSELKDEAGIRSNISGSDKGTRKLVGCILSSKLKSFNQRHRNC